MFWVSVCVGGSNFMQVFGKEGVIEGGQGEVGKHFCFCVDVRAACETRCVVRVLSRSEEAV